MIKNISIFTAIIITFIGCNKEKLTQETSELFVGQLILSNVDEVFERTDYVNLTITGNSYDLRHVTNTSNLCDSFGTQRGFGTNRISLSPYTTLPGINCDNKRIPKGEFKAVFNGTSLELGPKIDTLYIEIGENDTRREIWSYHFKLVEQ